jgi:peroxiredoxin Q/BCP
MAQTMPAEGSRAPGFSVTAHDGSTVTLEQFASKKHVVLFFYPRADTPG